MSLRKIDNKPSGGIPTGSPGLGQNAFPGVWLIQHFANGVLTFEIKSLAVLFLGILLLSLSCVFDNDTAWQETIRTEITESLAVPIQRVSSLEGVLSSGSSSQATQLKNPTFQELRDFILRDPTNRNKFVLNQYECRHFATDVNNNAETEGLRCAFVLLCYDRGQHAVVAFETDRGLVYIEPQTDAAIHPEVGGEYQGKEIKEILTAW